MKTYKDINSFNISAVSIDDHYQVMTGDEDYPLHWCSVDGMTFITPEGKEASIDSEGHSTDIEIRNGRIVFDSYKAGVDVDHYLESFNQDGVAALEIDFSNFQNFKLEDVYIVADYQEESAEDIHTALLIITDVTIDFTDGTSISATKQQLMDLHAHQQRSYARHILA